MQIEKNISLKKYNSFGVHVNAELFAEVKTIEDLKELFRRREYLENRSLILGGGSNILFTENYDGIVIKNSLEGIRVVSEDESSILIEAAGGENWDSLVEYCVKRQYWGLENLSLIPGTAGAAPIQNIGAYGAELTDVFDHLYGYDLHTSDERKFSNEQCRFSYRNSIFKNELKGKFIITSIVLKLSKVPAPNLRYAELKKEVGGGPINISHIRETVCNIRQRKLPDPEYIGNAGSFFKNPVVSISEYDTLKKEFPGLPGFSSTSDRIKISAGWLIEQCGLKGLKHGNAGVYEKQALVFVNYGGAAGKEILELAEIVKNAVLQKFKIELASEVNII